jgi:hypothetical protein
MLISLVIAGSLIYPRPVRRLGIEFPELLDVSKAHGVA